MKIYIASSWKNQHGVEMLTALLRSKGHEVISWVENNYGEDHNHVTKKFPFEEWVNSSEADKSFKFDTDGATNSDLVIYYAPSGKDAAAEIGAAWASGTPIIGLSAKGEDFGLMRKMMIRWCYRYTEVIETIEELFPSEKVKMVQNNGRITKKAKEAKEQIKTDAKEIADVPEIKSPGDENAESENKITVFNHTMLAGKKLFEERKYTEAEAKYKEALEIFPGNAKATEEQAKCAKWVKAMAEL